MFAIEKSKSSTNGLHRNSYGKTSNPVDIYLLKQYNKEIRSHVEVIYL